jgi:hypothetical protein
LRFAGLTLFLALSVCPAQQAGEAEQPVLPPVHTTIVIVASPVEPSIDHRNAEIFGRTLFSRDDQIFHVLDAGIDAGQHEGGGKSVEIRRFGFNLDHGGVSGGLKVLVDNVQQNQSTQGHGQGYLGSLKTLSPELVEEVNIINGPLSAEYGDFSGLGVVHIRTRETMPDRITARVQAGSFNTRRGFLALSPDWRDSQALVAWEGSYTDGPFVAPMRYRRNNLTASYTRRLSPDRHIGWKFNGGLNSFYSSGQVPLDEVSAGRLDRFGYIDRSDGGRVRSAMTSLYFQQDGHSGDVFKVDGFVSRSLLDLYSNFTLFLNDPVAGDAFQQHDSRLQQGVNTQYLRPHRLFGAQSLLTAGGNFNANQINVGLYPQIGRQPVGIATRANAGVVNGAGYAQESVSLLHGRVQLGGGMRFDEFRFDLRDRVVPERTGAENASRWQPKASASYTPSHRLPLTLYANYGRGISTADARGIVQHPEFARISTTDFYQVGTAWRQGRLAFISDLFWIDRSNELVYIPDDGSFEFKGPSRAYGFETKAAVDLTHHVALNGGITKVANAFYRGTYPRVYVDSAPHFVANAGLTVSAWKGWSGSLRMRAINHYRLDGQDPAILAGGHTVLDLGVARSIRRGVEFNFAVDNMADRAYYETQNYFESRLPGQDAAYRIHGTPGYPVNFVIGLTFRLFGL